MTRGVTGRRPAVSGVGEPQMVEIGPSWATPRFTYTWAIAPARSKEKKRLGLIIRSATTIRPAMDPSPGPSASPTWTASPVTPVSPVEAPKTAVMAGMRWPSSPRISREAGPGMLM
ncbi:MAG: hypothetical protein HYY66_02115 [Candidatus Tectomicrobia bacterium]|nr:hypothetical protein [Candidatus Tectomicrobia bacterium]